MLSACALAPAFAQTSVGVSIGINQPGVYGRIDIGTSLDKAGETNNSNASSIYPGYLAKLVAFRLTKKINSMESEHKHVLFCAKGNDGDLVWSSGCVFHDR